MASPSAAASFAPRIFSVGLGVGPQSILITQRELFRTLASVSQATNDVALTDVLHRAAQAAASASSSSGTTIHIPTRLILPTSSPQNAHFVAATVNRVLAQAKHAIHVARESLPIVGSVAAVAAVAAIGMHLTAYWIPRWMEAASATPARRRSRRASTNTTTDAAADPTDIEAMAAPTKEVEELMAEVTALRAELAHYQKKSLGHDTDSAAAADHIAHLTAVNAALTDSVKALESQLAARRVEEASLRGEIDLLRGEVDYLRAERESNERRMALLEGSLDSLRSLFTSITASNPSGVAATTTAAAAAAAAVAPRGGIRSADLPDLEPILPLIDLSSSSHAAPSSTSSSAILSASSISPPRSLYKGLANATSTAAATEQLNLVGADVLKEEEKIIMSASTTTTTAASALILDSSSIVIDDDDLVVSDRRPSAATSAGVGVGHDLVSLSLDDRDDDAHSEASMHNDWENVEHDDASSRVIV